MSAQQVAVLQGGDPLVVLLQGLLLLQAQLERVGCLVLKFTDALLVLGNTLAQQPHLFGLAVELRAQPPALVALRVQGRLQHLALQLDLGVAVTHPREVLPHALNLVLVHPDLGVGALANATLGDEIVDAAFAVVIARIPVLDS